MLSGMSESVAVLVTVSVVSVPMVRSGCGGSTGGLFTSVTVTVKLMVALKGGEPSSVTTVIKVLVLGPWASVGVQVMMPLAEIAALVGPDWRLERLVLL